MTDAELARLTALEAGLAKAEERIAELEKPWRKHIDTTIPPWVWPADHWLPRSPSLPEPITAGCSVCGLKADGPIGYVCPRLACPGRVIITSSSSAATPPTTV